MQGVKRGVMEVCELIAVTKADGDLLPSARRTQAEHISALKFFRPLSPNWRPKVLPVSAHSRQGLEELWSEGMAAFRTVMLRSGELEARRDRQVRAWMRRLLEEELIGRLRSHPLVRSRWSELEAEVRSGLRTPGAAAELSLQLFLDNPQLSPSPIHNPAPTER